MDIRLKFSFILLALSLVFLVNVYAEETTLPSSAGNVNSEVNDGSSVEKAITIIDISDYSKCRTEECISEEYGKSIDQEYEIYLPRLFGARNKAWKQGYQALIKEDSKFYDLIEIELLPLGEKKEVYFDISNVLSNLDKQLKKLPENSGDPILNSDWLKR